MPGLVIQSQRDPLPLSWLAPCIASVQGWSEKNGLAYRWLGDELFAPLPPGLVERFRSQIVIATDLARLHALRHALDEGYDPVIWFDSDFFIFDPERFVLSRTPYALGREIWVQQEPNGQLKTYRRVHNAFLMFRRGNALLEFYLETAKRLLQQLDGPVPPQFIGPKLLNALHNICKMPVMERAAMLSPRVLDDIERGSGEALARFRAQSPDQAAGANLCSSLSEATDAHIRAMRIVMDALENGILATGTADQGD